MIVCPFADGAQFRKNDARLIIEAGIISSLIVRS